MQGRLLPKYKRRYQAFPKNSWKDEFKIAKQLELDLIEFIFDFEDYTQNAVRFSAQEIELLRGQLGAPLGELKSAREQKGFEAKLRKFDK